MEARQIPRDGVSRSTSPAREPLYISRFRWKRSPCVVRVMIRGVPLAIRPMSFRAVPSVPTTRNGLGSDGHRRAGGGLRPDRVDPLVTGQGPRQHSPSLKRRADEAPVPQESLERTAIEAAADSPTLCPNRTHNWMMWTCTNRSPSRSFTGQGACCAEMQLKGIGPKVAGLHLGGTVRRSDRAHHRAAGRTGRCCAASARARSGSSR